jgi:glyoxylase-like metal-dependent hydrolase (beta-lactamase superfamily II)
MRDPILEPSFLYGGFSFLKMRSKFLVGPSCNVTDEINNTGKILETNLVAVPLSGHFFDMIGVLTPDGVFFLADSVFSEKIMEKYHLFFLYDVKSHLEMLNEIKKFDMAMFIPSHAEATKDIAPIIDKNIAKINEICAFLREICSGKTTEEIHAELCKKYSIVLNESQYVLTMSSLRSYLTYLSEKGEISYSFIDSRMIWSCL